jgi:hypothetical protein
MVVESMGWLQHVLRELPSSPVSTTCCTALLEAQSNFFISLTTSILDALYACHALILCSESTTCKFLQQWLMLLSLYEIYCESQPVLCKVVASIIQGLLGAHASGDTMPIVSFQCRISFELMYELVVCSFLRYSIVQV